MLFVVPCHTKAKTRRSLALGGTALQRVGAGCITNTGLVSASKLVVGAGKHQRGVELIPVLATECIDRFAHRSCQKSEEEDALHFFKTEFVLPIFSKYEAHGSLLYKCALQWRL